MCACQSQLVEDRILRSKQGCGGDAAQARCASVFRLLEEGHSLHPRSRTSMHRPTRLLLAAGEKTASARRITWWIERKSKVVERFIAQKTCDGKPYLRCGTAKGAVPSVGMTVL